MSDQPVIIEVKDSVDKGIARNLSEISSQARSAYQNVDKLIKQLARVKPRALDEVNRVVNKAQREMTQAALASERLATQQARTAQASANSATAQQRLAQATARTAQAESSAAAAALRLEAAQNRAAAAADKQAAAQQRASAAASQQSARLAAQDVEMNRINGVHDRFNALLARSPQYQKAFTAQNVAMAKAAGLNRHELLNLSHQVQDVVVSLQAGQRPMTVLLQQGSQIGSIFGGSGAGAGAIFRQLAGIVGTLVARLLPFAAAISAVLAPFSLFTREFNKGLDSEKMLRDLKLTEDQLKKLKESGETIGITFGDTFKATFQVIGQYANQYFKPVTDWVVKWWNIALDAITKYFSVWIRISLGNFLALANGIKAIWNNIPGAIELAAKKSVNALITAVEFAINTTSGALLNSPLGKFLGLDGPVDFKLPRLELSANASSLQEDIEKGVTDGFKTANEIVTKFGRDVRAQALKNAQDRIKAAAGEDDSSGGKGRRGFDRAKELAAINAELDAQAKYMFTLSTARDAYNRAEEIAIRFAKEGQPLTEKEIENLRNKIQALNDAKVVQQEFDRIYQNVAGPQRAYNASLEAAEKLLKMGAISQAQYTAELARAKDAYQNATDPLYQMNKELDEQLKLLKMLPKEREVEQQVMQAINKALQEGKPLRDEEIKQLREKLRLVQQVNEVSAIQANLMSNSSAGRQAGFDAQLQAIMDLMKNPNAQFGRNDAIGELANQMPDLFANTPELFQSQVASYQDMYAQIDALRQADLVSEQTAAVMRQRVWFQTQNIQLDAASNFFGQLAQLQKSENSKMAKIGKAAAIAQAMIQTYQSATSAYSAMAGIPYIGPALGVAAAAAAIAAGLANVAQIRAQPTGFKTGGYTGDMGVNQVAGSVHGKEYVFDAAATKRIGVSNLDAMRSGAMGVSRNSEKVESARQPPTVNVQPAPVTVPVQVISVQSREEALDAMRSVEGRAVVLETIEENPTIIARTAGTR